MAFENPFWLWLLPLAALPFLERRRLPAMSATSEAIVGSRTLRARLLPSTRVLAALAVAASVIAAAAPVGVLRRVADPRRARDIVIVLDTSESMRALDMAAEGGTRSRLEIAREFASDFIARREGDRIGIVAFGGRAVTQCPLTFDRTVARNLLDHVEPEMLGKRTALGEAVALAVARLPRGGAAVLVTDGQNTAGAVSVRDAARLAADHGVRIHAVAVGTDGPAPLPVVLPSGRTRIQQKDYPVDEAALGRLAEVTDGAFHRARDAGTLREVFGRIDRTEAHDVASRTTSRGRSPALALTAAGLVLLLTATASVVLRTAPLLR